MDGGVLLPSVAEMVARLRPDEPLHCVRPAALAEAALTFIRAFPGDVLYAVKCNPDPMVLRALWDGGIRHFDVASPAEFRLVARLFPGAGLHYMHPVKARSAIAAACHQTGVRDFALDTPDELDKLRHETGDARDLGLIVRLALPPDGDSLCGMSGKFGASPEAAVALLRAARRYARRLGISFHVGSQCLVPEAYERALALAGRVVAGAGVNLEILDVGGGFPVAYPGLKPPPAAAFLAAIERGVARLGLGRHCRLWCEPGRALTAAGVSVVTRVLQRRGHALYLTDGLYGSLADAGLSRLCYPARLIRPGGGEPAAPAPFTLFGPTCDSLDRIAGPFLIPDDVAEGDWIEFGLVGAYGGCLRTAFNGFGRARRVAVRDAPLVASV
jgi:ornithine decarboxylase